MKTIIEDILEGFIYLIGRGINHFDVKPANILISNGNYVIADFGIRQLFILTYKFNFTIVLQMMSEKNYQQNLQVQIPMYRPNF